MKQQKYDYIIIGAGLYGLYTAVILADRGFKVCILEYESAPMQRASLVNQARLHKGYHYPRSYATAIKCASYFDRFKQDFSFAINNKFLKIYAIADSYSLTSGEQFKKFCRYTGIPCREINPEKYYKRNLVDGVFETEEYAFDAYLIRDYFQDIIKKKENIDIIYNVRLKKAVIDGNRYLLSEKSSNFSAPGVINTTYAGINQILDLFGFEKFKLKYELCEIILCDVSENIKNTGLTLMDGPFFSLMPFGLTGLHSLTSVTFTPHYTSYDTLPVFSCQQHCENCSPASLANCNLCKQAPSTAWDYMYALSRKFLASDIELHYKRSLFSIKPILQSSELDDSRPTVIKKFSENPDFISVLSGKINTIYDMEDYVNQ